MGSCAPAVPRPSAGRSPSPAPPPSAAAAAASPAPAPHVFVIVMENRSYADALAGAYTSRLAQSYETLTAYYAISHPSLPNYLALTSGSTWGIADDNYHALPAGRDLGSELTAAGIPWRAYMEGLQPGGCLANDYPYAVRHNPFAYYGGGCPPEVVPYVDLTADLSSAAERFTWITPDVCDDGHDCTTQHADAWLKTNVGLILASPGWRNGGYLFITWDEDEGDSGNRVLTLVVTPGIRGRADGRASDHYGLLATVSHLLGVTPLGAAASARDILSRP